MVWYGVLLLKVHPKPISYVEVCILWHPERKQWEVPKGGAQWGQTRVSTNMSDANCFHTARAELWEECGVWLAMRSGNDLIWFNSEGDRLYEEYPEQNAFLLTKLRGGDTVSEPWSYEYKGMVFWVPVYAAISLLRTDHANMVMNALGILDVPMYDEAMLTRRERQWGRQKRYRETKQQY